MSAYQVSDQTLFVIVRAAIRGGCVARADATDLMRKLAIANDLSVSHRYGEEDQPETFNRLVYREDLFLVNGPAASAVAVLKLIQCLDHQSSDHPGWLESDAFKALQSIQAATIRALPGYAEAAWGL